VRTGRCSRVDDSYVDAVGLVLVLALLVLHDAALQSSFFWSRDAGNGPMRSLSSKRT
jgi:hypothetical protein